MQQLQLDGSLFCQMFLQGTEKLRRNIETVNQLNVFPIPDGDTGDNMYATAAGGAQAARLSEVNLNTACRNISNQMLFSARGNSGVIFSRFFEGIAQYFAEFSLAEPAQLAKAFSCGVQQAYSAVSNPTEGTLLTVMREAAEQAAVYCTDLTTYMQAFVQYAEESVRRTPEQLPVLKEAGVVDSGGVGFLVFAEGMLAALKGEFFTEESSEPNNLVAHSLNVEAFTTESELVYGYCTEFLLRLQTKKVKLSQFEINGFTAQLQKFGDSIVAFQNESIVKVHIHTKMPGEVLNFGQQYGEFLKLKIENMSLQHNETVVESTAERFKFKTAPETKNLHVAVVAVASGSGLQQLMGDYGADCVLDGGQSCNPSTEDFLQAIGKLQAEHIILLPNNGNVILAARQAAELCQNVFVHVVPTKTVGEGVVALTMMDKETADFNAMLSEMENAAVAVRTAYVSRAVRPARLKKLDIQQNDYIAFIEKDIFAAAPQRLEAAKQAVLKAAAGREILMLIRGNGTAEAELKELSLFARQQFSQLEIYEINGEQPLYDFIIVAQ